jgi:hypothetical protein
MRILGLQLAQYGIYRSAHWSHPAAADDRILVISQGFSYFLISFKMLKISMQHYSTLTFRIQFSKGYPCETCPHWLLITLVRCCFLSIARYSLTHLLLLALSNSLTKAIFIGEGNFIQIFPSLLRCFRGVTD